MSKRQGYRGYIASREIRGVTFPQHVQNLVIRDYAQRQKLLFLLSATEYAMPACYMMLDSILHELSSLEGIILFSLFMLPDNRSRRVALYQQVLGAGASLHAALEGFSIRSADDIDRAEDILLVEKAAVRRTSSPLDIE